MIYIAAYIQALNESGSFVDETDKTPKVNTKYNNIMIFKQLPTFRPYLLWSMLSGVFVDHCSLHVVLVPDVFRITNLFVAGPTINAMIQTFFRSSYNTITHFSSSVSSVACSRTSALYQRMAACSTQHGQRSFLQENGMESLWMISLTWLPFVLLTEVSL